MNSARFLVNEWSRCFIKNKWLFLQTFERGDTGRTVFEMDAYEWPVFLHDLKTFRMFFSEIRLVDYYPKGAVNVVLSGNETLSELFLALFMPLFFGNKTQIFFPDCLTFFMDALKQELRNNFLLKKANFVQMNSKPQRKISLSILTEEFVSLKNGILSPKSETKLDHLIWSAFYGQGTVSGSLKLIFVPDEKLNYIFDRLTFFLDQTRGPFQDQNFFENTPSFAEYSLFKNKLTQDPQFRYSTSVFNKNFFLFSTKTIKNLPQLQELPYGPYFILCGYHYLKNLVLRLNSFSSLFHSTSVMGECTHAEKSELKNLHTPLLSFQKHVLIEKNYTLSKLNELQWGVTSKKEEFPAPAVWNSFEYHSIQAWKHRKMVLDASKFRRALPVLSKRLFEKLKT